MLIFPNVTLILDLQKYDQNFDDAGSLHGPVEMLADPVLVKRPTRAWTSLTSAIFNSVGALK